MVPDRSRRTASRVTSRDDLLAELGMSGGLQVTHDIKFRDRYTSLYQVNRTSDRGLDSKV